MGTPVQPTGRLLVLLASRYLTSDQCTSQAQMGTAGPDPPGDTAAEPKFAGGPERPYGRQDRVQVSVTVSSPRLRKLTSGFLPTSSGSSTRVGISSMTSSTSSCELPPLVALPDRRLGRFQEDWCTAKEVATADHRRRTLVDTERDEVAGGGGGGCLLRLRTQIEFEAPATAHSSPTGSSGQCHSSLVTPATPAIARR